MPYQTNSWTPQQLDKMNKEDFMVVFLDTFKISPVTSDSDEAIESMKDKLTRVEEKLDN